MERPRILLSVLEGIFFAATMNAVALVSGDWSPRNALVILLVSAPLLTLITHWLKVWWWKRHTEGTGRPAPERS